MMNRNSRNAGFTLTELMVVIGIVGLLAIFAIPAFQGMGRGTRMQSALFGLRSTLALSRQWAITQRHRTYVLFPDDANVSGQHADKAFTSYIAYTREDGYLGEWQQLPPGIIFDPDYRPNNTGRNLWNVQSTTLGGFAFDLDLPDIQAEQGVVGIMFRPDGGLGGYNNAGQLIRGAPVEIVLTEGWVNVVGGTPAYEVPDSRMIFSIDVNPLTGGYRVREYNSEL